VDHIISLGVLGAAIKGFLMAAVNLAHQDSFGVIDGLNLAVSFFGCISRSANRADQNQNNYIMSDFFHLTILNLYVGKAKLQKEGHPVFFSMLPLPL
jgi:hypothetical protein